ncbi:MAG: polyhydroxyalkanoate synthesis repressor PhaR [Pannonibacter phragmitetus]
MAKTTEPTIIKKYANRRLYNTGTSTYVTLEDLAVMVKGEEDFVVFDAKTGEDITRSVLTQIIFEQEGKGGQNLLPITFLRQLIRFYGDSMQGLVPSYLEFSISSLTKEQDKLRAQMSEAFGASAFEMMEEQVKRNTEMFERAMKMFMPFSLPAAAAPGTAAAPAAAPEKPAASAGSDLDDMKKQLAAMQLDIEQLKATKGAAQ